MMNLSYDTAFNLAGWFVHEILNSAFWCFLNFAAYIWYRTQFMKMYK